MIIRYWFTITQAAVAALLVTAPAGAVSSKVLKDTAFELTVGYQCEKVLKDERPYRTAKRKAARLLGQKEAAKLIEAVESQPRNSRTRDKGFCEMMTKNMRH